MIGSETPSNPGGVSEEFKRRDQQREKDRREHGIYASSKEDRSRERDREKARDKGRDRRSERGDLKITWSRRSNYIFMENFRSWLSVIYQVKIPNI